MFPQGNRAEINCNCSLQERTKISISCGETIPHHTPDSGIPDLANQDTFPSRAEMSYCSSSVQRCPMAALSLPWLPDKSGHLCSSRTVLQGSSRMHQGKAGGVDSFEENLLNMQSALGFTPSMRTQLGQRDNKGCGIVCRTPLSPKDNKHEHKVSMLTSSRVH